MGLEERKEWADFQKHMILCRIESARCGSFFAFGGNEAATDDFSGASAGLKTLSLQEL